MKYADVAVGDEMETSTYEVTADEIVAFAERWDPQPFHVDPEAAAASPFGTLVASGWHTACITMRLLVTEVFGPGGSLGSPGVESLAWPNPLLPGEAVSASVEVTTKRPLESDPSRGLIRTATATTTTDGTPVLEMDATVFLARDAPDEN